jgi:hypothetical protein
VKVLRSTSKWWTVNIAGSSDDTTLDELIRSYREILRLGIKRVRLDLAQTNSEFTLVHRRTPDVLEEAMGFQRVAVQVSGARTAFRIKASTKVPEDGFSGFLRRGKTEQLA